ncbi:MAG: hypothetical protein KIT79_08240 [Deltaproteobacteria bacterium]|nr:hypothetical protein [Deltaproteobacteria bacterium]
MALVFFDGSTPDPELLKSVRSNNFERKREMPKPMLAEIGKSGWPVAGPDAYPRILWTDTGNVNKPITEREVDL